MSVRVPLLSRFLWRRRVAAARAWQAAERLQAAERSKAVRRILAQARTER